MGSGMDLGAIEYGRMEIGFQDLDLGSSRNRVDRVSSW